MLPTRSDSNGHEAVSGCGSCGCLSCKLTARADGIAEACRKAREIKKLAPTREGSPLRELYAPLVFRFLAHSHRWGAPASRPLDNVVSNVVRGLEEAGHPRGAIDLVCVADLGSTRVYKAPDLRVFTNPPGPSPVKWAISCRSFLREAGSKQRRRLTGWGIDLRPTSNAQFRRRMPLRPMEALCRRRTFYRGEITMGSGLAGRGCVLD